jgi:hypothetical protein
MSEGKPFSEPYGTLEALRRHGTPEVPDPSSTARMLAFLKKAQAVLHPGRG